jgi:hypothetical protein
MNKKSSDLFKSAIDKEFSKIPNLNKDTMSDANEYKKNFTEEEDNIKGKVKKRENTEATSSGSSGAFVSPINFSNDFMEKSNSENKKMETKEATSSSSVGSYVTPAAWAKSTKKKDWRGKNKPQIPGGSFVSVKKKCKKFPYCNQGDIKALNIYKNESLKEAISNVSNKLGITESVIMSIIQHEIESMSKSRK